MLLWQTSGSGRAPTPSDRQFVASMKSARRYSGLVSVGRGTTSLLAIEREGRMTSSAAFAAAHESRSGGKADIARPRSSKRRSPP